jgi:hypothetical protein
MYREHRARLRLLSVLDIPLVPPDALFNSGKRIGVEPRWDEAGCRDRSDTRLRLHGSNWATVVDSQSYC